METLIDYLHMWEARMGGDDESSHGFRGVAAGNQLGAHVFRGGLSAAAGRRVGLEVGWLRRCASTAISYGWNRLGADH